MFQAGTAVAYGLSKEEAVAAITYNTAKILGADAKLGSIEKGKDASTDCFIGRCAGYENSSY
jgi:imidazolonepropionase-like amidohydrolase